MGNTGGKRIKFLVMDVDGTLTDGKIYIGDKGELFKAFDVKDGYGIKHILDECNIVPVVITARQSEILRLRCRELGIVELHQGILEKLSVLQGVIEKYSLNDGTAYSLENVAYIGDDILDLQCMKPIEKAGGSTGCPKDAVREVQEVAEYISAFNGGRGAVRDYIEWLRKKKVI